MKLGCKSYDKTIYAWKNYRKGSKSSDIARGSLNVASKKKHEYTFMKKFEKRKCQKKWLILKKIIAYLFFQYFIVEKQWDSLNVFGLEPLPRNKKGRHHKTKPLTKHLELLLKKWLAFFFLYCKSSKIEYLKKGIMPNNWIWNLQI